MPPLIIPRLPEAYWRKFLSIMDDWRGYEHSDRTTLDALDRLAHEIAAWRLAGRPGLAEPPTEC